LVRANLPIKALLTWVAGFIITDERGYI